MVRVGGCTHVGATEHEKIHDQLQVTEHLPRHVQGTDARQCPLHGLWDRAQELGNLVHLSLFIARSSGGFNVVICWPCDGLVWNSVAWKKLRKERFAPWHHCWETWDSQQRIGSFDQ